MQFYASHCIFLHLLLCTVANNFNIGDSFPQNAHIMSERTMKKGFDTVTMNFSVKTAVIFQLSSYPDQ